MPVQLTTEVAELASFLGALADDMAWLSFADWFDERYPATAVRRGELPEGFRA